MCSSDLTAEQQTFAAKIAEFMLAQMPSLQARPAPQLHPSLSLCRDASAEMRMLQPHFKLRTSDTAHGQRGTLRAPPQRNGGEAGAGLSVRPGAAGPPLARANSEPAALPRLPPPFSGPPVPRYAPQGRNAPATPADVRRSRYIDMSHFARRKQSAGVADAAGVLPAKQAGAEAPQHSTQQQPLGLPPLSDHQQPSQSTQWPARQRTASPADARDEMMHPASAGTCQLAPSLFPMDLPSPSMPSPEPSCEAVEPAPHWDEAAGDENAAALALMHMLSSAPAPQRQPKRLLQSATSQQQSIAAEQHPQPTAKQQRATAQKHVQHTAAPPQPTKASAPAPSPPADRRSKVAQPRPAAAAAPQPSKEPAQRCTTACAPQQASARKASGSMAADDLLAGLLEAAQVLL